MSDRECMKEKASSESSTQRHTHTHFDRNTMRYYTLLNLFFLLNHYYYVFYVLNIYICYIRFLRLICAYKTNIDRYSSCCLIGSCYKRRRYDIKNNLP